MNTILAGITGASGSIYGLRLLQELEKKNITVHLIISESAKQIFTFETNESIEKLKQYAAKTYENNDLFAGPASGSFPLDAMVIVPCSMKTLSAIANGYADTLIVRSAICRLKEKKPLIVVPRETPMDYTSLKNMLALSQAGGVVLPAAPGFYHQPQSVSDLVDFIVGKILDQLSISHDLYKRWE